MIHVAMFQNFRRAHMLLGVLAVEKSQETQGLLDEIQMLLNVFVLKSTTIVTTSVATANSFLVDGSSTESVSRVVGTARTRHENH